MNAPDVAIIVMIMFLLWAVKRPPELVRNDRPPRDLFSDLTKMLLLVGAAMWAIIIAEYL